MFQNFIYIIIINFNGGDYILDCVDSVTKTTNSHFEIILIDNNSTDNSSNLCKDKFDQIRLFQSDKNLGMAARNIGLDNAKGEFIVILNPDTIVDPNWINELIIAQKEFGDALYQPKILSLNEENIIELKNGI